MSFPKPVGHECRHRVGSRLPGLRCSTARSRAAFKLCEARGIVHTISGSARVTESRFPTAAATPRHTPTNASANQTQGASVGRLQEE
jgi:hypothetical protein